jgi:hypothetical protein
MCHNFFYHYNYNHTPGHQTVINAKKILIKPWQKVHVHKQVSVNQQKEVIREYKQHNSFTYKLPTIDILDTLQNSHAKFPATDTRSAALLAPPLRTHKAPCILYPAIITHPQSTLHPVPCNPPIM